MISKNAAVLLVLGLAVSSTEAQAPARLKAAIVGPSGENRDRFDVFLADRVVRSDDDPGMSEAESSCPATACRVAGRGSTQQLHSWWIYRRGAVDETLLFRVSAGLIVYHLEEYDLSGKEARVALSKDVIIPFDSRRFAAAAGKSPGAPAGDVFNELAASRSPASGPLLDYFLELAAEGRSRAGR